MHAGSSSALNMVSSRSNLGSSAISTRRRILLVMATVTRCIVVSAVLRIAPAFLVAGPVHIHDVEEEACLAELKSALAEVNEYFADALGREVEQVLRQQHGTHGTSRMRELLAFFAGILVTVVVRSDACVYRLSFVDLSRWRQTNAPYAEDLEHGASERTAGGSPVASGTSREQTLDTASDRVRLCQEESCPFAAHPWDEFEGYCCWKCHEGQGHGKRCYQEVVRIHAPTVVGNPGALPLTFLHGSGGSPSDLRTWLMPNVQWERYALLELPGVPRGWLHRGFHDWFAYGGQFALWGEGHAFQDVLAEVVDNTAAHAKHGRIKIVGYSQGGAVSILAAAVLKHRGFLPEVLVLRGQFEMGLCRELRTLGWDFCFEFPIMALHGASDRTAPEYAARKGWDALQSWGCAVTVLEAEGQNHTSFEDVAEVKQILEWVEGADEFL